VLNSLADYREQAVGTLQSTTGHDTGWFPMLSDLVTDMIETTDS